MREILFKGKTIDTGEWVVGRCLSDDVIVPINQEFTIDGNTIYDNLRAFCVDPDTIKQFTGLYDCTKFNDLAEEEKQEWLKFHKPTEWKGRRIFEGDTVNIFNDGIPGGFWKIDTFRSYEELKSTLRQGYADIRVGEPIPKQKNL